MYIHIYILPNKYSKQSGLFYVDKSLKSLRLVQPWACEKLYCSKRGGGDLICSSSNEIKPHSLFPSPWTWVEYMLQIDILELLNTSHCVLFFSVQPTWDSGEESVLKKYIYCKTIYAGLVQISSAEKLWNRKAAGLLRFHLSSIFAHPSCQPQTQCFQSVLFSHSFSVCCIQSASLADIEEWGYESKKQPLQAASEYHRLRPVRKSYLSYTHCK